jgi:hypothetical protein
MSMSPAEIFEAATAAAVAARDAEVDKLVPMTVVGGGKTYHVSGGPCGFASVIIKPARGAFVTWCKKQVDSYGRVGLGYKAYYGGWSLSSHNFTQGAGPLCQSMQLNEAICRAAAKVFTENGIVCHVESRMD